MEPVIDDYVFIRLEGTVNAVTETTISVDGLEIPREKIFETQIKPRYTAGQILYSGPDTFYLRLQSGDWAYSLDGSLYPDAAVENMLNKNILVNVRPKR